MSGLSGTPAFAQDQQLIKPIADDQDALLGVNQRRRTFFENDFPRSRAGKSNRALVPYGAFKRSSHAFEHILNLLSGGRLASTL